jgi:hypothetical protein
MVCLRAIEKEIYIVRWEKKRKRQWKKGRRITPLEAAPE